MSLRRIVTILLAFAACLHADEAVSFRRDIAPLLQRRCANCHNDDNSKGGYRLDSLARLRTPGDSGDAPITAGKPRDSLVFKLLISTDADERMPQKADPLPPDELALIERWLTQGATSDADRDDQPLAELARERHLRPAPPHYARPLAVTALAFDDSARRLASSGYREVLVWDTASGALLRRVGGLPERITGLAWHGNTLAVAGGTPGQWGTIALVDSASDFRPRLLCDLPEMSLCLAFSPNGHTLAAGCGDRTLRLFDLDTAPGKILRFLGAPPTPPQKILRHHADWIQSVAFSPSGKRLVTASRDRTARVLDANWELEATYDDHGAPLLASAFAPDGSRIVTTARGGSVHVWHWESTQKRGDLIDTGGEVRQLVSGPFGLAAGGADGTVRLYQMGDREPWLAMPGHRAPIESLAAATNGELLASGSADGEIIVWSALCWEPTLRFRAMP
jgi:WD40 repeat protein